MKTKGTLRQLILIGLLLAAPPFFNSASASAGQVHLSVAASMTDAVNRICASYRKTHPDVALLPNFASSGALAKQIDLGAPADLFISANPKWMDYLVDAKRIPAAKVRILAYNGLVFAGAKGLGITSLHDLLSLKRIAIGSPASVPAGQYARQALEAAGVYSKLSAAGKLVMAKDVRQALIYADRGEVDGAFVYRTDALLARHAVILFAVPQKLYDRIRYPVGLTAAGAENPAAVAFFDYLQQDDAKEILHGFGFITE